MSITIDKIKQSRKANHIESLGGGYKEYYYRTADEAQEDAVKDGYIYRDEKGYYKWYGKVPVDTTDEEYAELCKVLPPYLQFERPLHEMCDTLNRIRKMMTFFTVLTVLSIIASLIIVISDVL